jgi:uroporphyrinogen-III synthase
VWVTRPKERAEELCFLLEDEGADVLCLPLLEFSPPTDGRPLAAAAERVQRYRWVAFASPAAVAAFTEAARQAATLTQLSRVSMAAVGPKTAEALRERGLEVAVEARETTGLGLYEALKPQLAPGDEVLLPAAEEGRRELEESLLAQGVPVTRVAAYRSVPVALDAATRDWALAHPADVILFASPRTVQAFLDAWAEQGRGLLSTSLLVAIGPTTASALTERGFYVSGVAERPTSEGLVDAAAKAVLKKSSLG